MEEPGGWGVRGQRAAWLSLPRSMAHPIVDPTNDIRIIGVATVAVLLAISLAGTGVGSR